mgnify:CR=1 FL=1
MTLTDLARKSDALESLRLDWSRAIVPTVESKIEDAHAHAERAVTQSLKATADGRPTARKANRSTSFQAALSRLDELLDWLAGPSANSLRGRVRDAREAFYKRAFALHKPLIPKELYISLEPEPTFANLRLIRGALIHGLDLRKELDGPIATAKRQLTAAVALAGQRATSGAASSEILETWYRQSLASIRTAVLRVLSDSVEFADTEAGTDLIHPDYLETE